MPSPQTISAEQARRFLVTRHLLAPPRSLPADAKSVLRLVERIGLVQFDPVEVPGARSHDLTLHNRIAGYQHAWLDRWLYGPRGGDPRDRRLIELYNKSLNILPMEELPYHAVSWDRYERLYRDGILREQSNVVEAVLGEIEKSGPLSTAAFRDHNHAVDWWWAPTSAARAVMEALFVTGRLGIARRDGSRRSFDLIERLVPARLLGQRVPVDDAMRHRLLSRYRAVGLLGNVGTAAEIILGTGSAADRTRWTAELVDQGALIPAGIEGIKGGRYLLAEEQSILASAFAPLRGKPQVTLMAPLDPLVWDRRLLRELFGFDYTWEIYVPEAKRRHGYYVLPLLFGDRFIGRIEPRYERRDRALRILGIWFEDGFEPMSEPGFLDALADAMAAYSAFIGARSLTWPRTRPGRDIAGALRRLPAA